MLTAVGSIPGARPVDNGGQRGRLCIANGWTVVCQWPGVDHKGPFTSIERTVMATQMSIGDEAERFLASLAPAAGEPEPHECLRCFVRRAVSRHGCDGRLRFVRRWLQANPTAPPNLIDELEDQAGYCDCEVVLNVFRDEIPPASRPLLDCPSVHPRASTSA
jgi:hypothetical protein